VERERLVVGGGAADVVAVTGGGSGIGRAACARLARDGLRVAVVDLEPGEPPPGGIAVRADVADQVAVERAFADIDRRLGPVGVLVTAAGITGSRQATVCHETPVEEWDRVQAVNVRGAFLCIRAVLPGMLRAGGGRVITVASVAGMVAFPGRCAYTASKGAVLQLTRSVAVDYARQGIRANAVCPGFADTPMTRWRLDVPELRADVEARIPLGRVATADEVADAIALLASDRLAYMTGHALVVDGGWTAW
jgi:NAD(P)-dependent dehydrogenase (short-subunit alcohol dehydrogenase family)